MSQPYKEPSLKMNMLLCRSFRAGAWRPMKAIEVNVWKYCQKELISFYVRYKILLRRRCNAFQVGYRMLFFQRIVTGLSICRCI